MLRIEDFIKIKKLPKAGIQARLSLIAFLQSCLYSRQQCLTDSAHSMMRSNEQISSAG
jgi:hypothetical protein